MVEDVVPVRLIPNEIVRKALQGERRVRVEMGPLSTRRVVARILSMRTHQMDSNRVQSGAMFASKRSVHDALRCTM